MRKWTRVAYREFCGSCGTELPANAPVMEIAITALKKPKYRCQLCVGPAPPDLPDRVVLQETIDTKIARLRDMAIHQELEQKFRMPHNSD